jgi:nucleoside-diphosphate-sugar epimerase
MASWPGDLDVPHSWNYTEDIARALVAASRTDAAWGRPWHVPVTSSLSVRALSERLADMAEAPTPKLHRIDRDELAALARQQPLFGELMEMMYSNENPHVIDSSRSEAVLGVQATPLDTVLQDILAGAVGATGDIADRLSRRLAP